MRVDWAKEFLVNVLEDDQDTPLEDIEEDLKKKRKKRGREREKIK